MKIRADMFGIELNELVMDKFDACVDEIVSHDNERAQTENP